MCCLHSGSPYPLWLLPGVGSPKRCNTLGQLFVLYGKCSTVRYLMLLSLVFRLFFHSRKPASASDPLMCACDAHNLFPVSVIPIIINDGAAGPLMLVRALSCLFGSVLLLPACTERSSVVPFSQQARYVEVISAPFDGVCVTFKKPADRCAGHVVCNLHLHHKVFLFLAVAESMHHIAILIFFPTRLKSTPWVYTYVVRHQN